MKSANLDRKSFNGCFNLPIFWKLSELDESFKSGKRNLVINMKTHRFNEKIHFNIY